jgi:hypothetical protein
MILRDRIGVTQLYRAEYDAKSKRSKTRYLGAFAKHGVPSPLLLAALTEPERRQLEDVLAARAAARDEIVSCALFAGAPADLRRIAAWLRRQAKSPQILRGAKELRDAYTELYAAMRALGVARLRGASPRSAKRAASASPLVLDAGSSADAAPPVPPQDRAGSMQAPLQLSLPRN